MPEVPTAKPKWTKNKKYMLIRYGRMNNLGFFEHNETNIPKTTIRVVVETEKGLELGYLVGQLASYRGGRFKLNDEQLQKYLEDSGIELPFEQAGKFIRFATATDINEEQHLQKIAEEEIECCRRFTKEMNLPMKVVDVEHIFGGERVIFYFMADGRVDFRELVKKLAQEYQTRIEMRQIGSRDEAKLLGDVETCGQECCCAKFLKFLKPVNMRMAKMQKATLDPSKISGFCGRLKCCLRYEDKTYTELKRNLPRKNSRVKTKHGEGKIVDTQILTQLAVVEYDSGGKAVLPVDELEIISSPADEQKTQDDIQDSDEENIEENEKL
jgi:cell fate regulator YaaT (PSP1 superfamily)